ncbi:MAG: nucleotidyltransferase [Omnitrophica bacterium]|nr:nucleotidyltransferase [Candidatus Omnitrophota bacterium]
MLQDYLKLYKSLNRNRVRYLLIGGIACIVYGVPRTTLDIDIFIESSLKNAILLLKALKEAGFGTESLTTPEMVVKNEINIFEDYLRLDVFTSLKGLKFTGAWGRRCIKKIDGIKIKLASLEDILKSKKAYKRNFDKQDIRILSQILRKN